MTWQFYKPQFEVHVQLSVISVNAEIYLVVKEITLYKSYRAYILKYNDDRWHECSFKHLAGLHPISPKVRKLEGS